jgi:equilibrative nucleoside transporter 1/2/3
MDNSFTESLTHAHNDNGLKGQLSAFIIFFVLGVGNLLPWNAFITASTYYKNRFCGTAFENSFESFFSMFYTVSQPIGLLATIFFKKKFTTKALVLYPLMIYTAIFILTTVLVLVPSIPQELLFSLTLISAFLCGLCAAVMNGGMFGLSGILPSVYTGALMSGQGLAGTAVSTVSIIIVGITTNGKCSTSDDASTDDGSTCDSSNAIDYGAFAYFLVSTICLGTCIVLFVRLLYLEYVRYYMRLHLQEHLFVSEAHSNPLHEPVLATLGQTSALSSHHSVQSLKQILETGESRQSSRRLSLSDMIYHDDIIFSAISSPLSSNFPSSQSLSAHVPPVPAAATPSAPVISPPKDMSILSFAEIWRILRTIALPASSVFIVFAGTLAVFPSVIVLIQAQHSCHNASDSIYGDDLWVPFLFLLLNVFDFLGRISAPYLKNQPRLRHIITPASVFGAAIVRLLIPLFLCMSNIDGNRLPIITKNDGVTWLLTALLGFTNGSVANIAMMQGPSLVNEGADASLAGTIMVFCLSSGLLMGSCLSFLLLFIVVGA